jgi:hypothetical protein
MPRKNTRRTRRVRKQRGGIHTVLADRDGMYKEMLTFSEYRRLDRRERYNYEKHIIVPQYRHVLNVADTAADDTVKAVALSRLLYLCAQLFEHSVESIRWMNHVYIRSREFDGDVDRTFRSRLNKVGVLIMGIEHGVHDINVHGYDEIYA